MEGQLILEVCILVFVLLLSRLLFVIHKVTTGHSRQDNVKRTKACSTMICIGSGGHTTEMLRLIEPLDFTKYTPRYYILANSDVTSFNKIMQLEMQKKLSPDTKTESEYRIIKIPRSRVVSQSYITSIFTTLYSIIYSIPIVVWLCPDLVLCNGPGTCIPICASAFLMKVAFVKDIRIVFVESFCRTQTFSLSGKILTYMADNFLVQWPSLKKKLKRSEYIGKLM